MAGKKQHNNYGINYGAGGVCAERTARRKQERQERQEAKALERSKIA